MSYQFSNEEISPKRSIKRRSSPRKVLHISGKSIVAYCRPQTKFGVKVIFLHCLSFCSQGGVPASGGLLLGMGGSAPRGVAWSRGGACSRGEPGGDPPGRLLLRAVRILLECILVYTAEFGLQTQWLRYTVQKFSYCRESDSDSNPNCQLHEWDQN